MDPGAADAEPASSPPVPCRPQWGIMDEDSGILSAADGGAPQLVFSMVQLLAIVWYRLVVVPTLVCRSVIFLLFYA